MRQKRMKHSINWSNGQISKIIQWFFYFWTIWDDLKQNDHGQFRTVIDGLGRKCDGNVSKLKESLWLIDYYQIRRISSKKLHIFIKIPLC